MPLGGYRLDKDAFEDGELRLRGCAAGDERHEVAGAHGAAAGHLPRRGPAQRAGHGIDELVDVLDSERERVLIKLDKCVREVVIVDEDEVCLLGANEGVHRRGGTIDIEFFAADTGDSPVDHVVEADREAVRAQRVAGLLNGK